ncbi:glutathione S-transferase family protein [Frigidibacter sp. SD6-1]|uniref:glutathione S-transferase family protein n=1 Tax=Frigidibacter sp. SD6-1 TaxID=3032581 RepID=UPI0024E00C90|nr:glutathione S-transferase family protein [Frigidibacter sp. SD6-1]
MYRLHFTPDAASLAVRLVLEELGQPYEARLIDRAGGELQSESYRALQPLGLIPVLETPDGPMFETAAILLYLADRHGGIAPAPADPDRAQFLKWLFFIAHNIHPTLLQLFYPDRTAGPDCARQVVDHASTRMQGFLSIFDRMLAEERPTWFSADRPSLMAYYLGLLMRWLAAPGARHSFRFPPSDYPAIHAVLLAHEARPAAIKAAGAESLGPTLFTDPA